MTDNPNAQAVAELVERLLQLAGNTGKITWVNNKPETASDALRQSAAALTTLSRRNEELEVENARLRQALNPFVRIANFTHALKPGASTRVNVDKCREARAALKEKNNG